MSPRKPIALDAPAIDADPFAGDDELWAEEDVARPWMDDTQTARNDHVTFFRVLVLVGVASGVLWAAVLAVGVEVYRLLAG